MIWVNRKWELGISSDLFPMTVSRLRGAPARLEELMLGVEGDILTKKFGKAWSIKEEIGHLCLVEGLWLGRMDDYRDKKESLRPAVMDPKLKEIDFNGMPLEKLLEDFRTARREFVSQLEKLEKEDAEMSAHHPRLNKPMRMVDHVYFAAEHDDHHLAKIYDLVNSTD